jgi:hypothetical protein
MNALPALLFSDEALMQLVGFNAQQANMATTSFTSVRNEADLTRDVRSLPRMMCALPG